MVILNVKNLNNKNKTKIAMTLGDPSGIGPEVVAKSIQHLSNKGDELPFIIGDTNIAVSYTHLTLPTTPYV